MLDVDGFQRGCHPLDGAQTNGVQVDTITNTITNTIRQVNSMKLNQLDTAAQSHLRTPDA